MAAIVIPSALDTLSVANDFERFQAVRAEVTTQRPQRHQKGPETELVEFEFKLPDGTLVRGDNALTRVSDSPERVEELVEREGGVDRITVYYDPQDPSRAVIHEVGMWQPLGFIGLSFFLLVGGVHASYLDRKRRKLQAVAINARRRR